MSRPAPRRALANCSSQHTIVGKDMPITQKYLHDKLVLLLVSVTIFLAFLCVILVLLRLGVGQGGYIVQYRANLGFNAFKTGSVTGLLEFAIFAVLIAVANISLSMRTYQLRRELSVTVLILGVLILIMAIIVSNALLVLR